MTGGQFGQFHLTQTVLAALFYEVLFARSDIRKSAGNCSPCAEDKGSNGSVSDHGRWRGGLGPEQTQAQPALLTVTCSARHMEWERGLSGTFPDLGRWARRSLVCQVVGNGRGRGVAELMERPQLCSRRNLFPSHRENYKVRLYFKELAWFTSWPA